jgi:hypothetical protein
MILISHRGNLNEKIETQENQPDYILEAIKQGYNVEIDVWFEDGKFKLGHDKPQYDFPLALLENWYHVLWIHCKNPEALVKLNEIDKIGVKFNYFFHNIDYAVLTSKGYIWSINPINSGILVVPETTGNKPVKSTLGICSDYISRYR